MEQMRYCLRSSGDHRSSVELIEPISQYILLYGRYLPSTRWYKKSHDPSLPISLIRLCSQVKFHIGKRLAGDEKAPGLVVIVSIWRIWGPMEGGFAGAIKLTMTDVSLKACGFHHHNKYTDLTYLVRQKRSRLEGSIQRIGGGPRDE